MTKLTLSRIRQIERELAIADVEINSIIATYYVAPGGQNIGGHIGEISKLHAQNVEQLADVKRELLQTMKARKKRGKV